MTVKGAQSRTSLASWKQLFLKKTLKTEEEQNMARCEKRALKT